MNNYFYRGLSATYRRILSVWLLSSASARAVLKFVYTAWLRKLTRPLWGGPISKRGEPDE